MIPIIDKDNCTGCGKCREICPPGAVDMIDDRAVITADLCEECGFCAAECPVEAIAIPFPMSNSR